MPDAGLLLTLPAQSVTVRLLLGAVTAVIAARLLLRAGLRVPRIRVAAALLPASVLLFILAISLGSYRLPTVMVPNSAVGSVVVPIENTYAYLAPLALPALLAAWALVVVARVGWRLSRTWRFTRQTARSVSVSPVPVRVRQVVHRVASHMGLDAPPIGMAEGCPGGASVVGVRHPTLVLDAELVKRLDAQELEGVVAHELAHIRRRDNLVALLLSVTRDVVFFVPGGRWALRQLLVEREMAADHLAVATTHRPGALAGGLLKVLEGAGPQHACAALLPQGTLVRRVSQLIENQPQPTRTRTASEFVALTTAFAIVVLAATATPRIVAGSDPDGGLGVMFTTPQQAQPTADAVTTDHRPRVFETYSRAALRTTPTTTDRAPVIDDDPDLLRRSRLAACVSGDASCGVDAHSATLGLRPRQQVELEDAVKMRWHAHPVMDTGNMVRIYWLSTIR